MLPRLRPINLTRIESLVDHDDFIFELKRDGFRAVAYIENGGWELVSRRQRDRLPRYLRPQSISMRCEMLDAFRYRREADASLQV